MVVTPFEVVITHEVVHVVVIVVSQASASDEKKLRAATNKNKIIYFITYPFVKSEFLKNS